MSKTQELVTHIHLFSYFGDYVDQTRLRISKEKVGVGITYLNLLLTSTAFKPF